jgi:hypothetical protein
LIQITVAGRPAVAFIGLVVSFRTIVVPAEAAISAVLNSVMFEARAQPTAQAWCHDIHPNPWKKPIGIIGTVGTVPAASRTAERVVKIPLACSHIGVASDVNIGTGAGSIKHKQHTEAHHRWEYPGVLEFQWSIQAIAQIDLVLC